MICYRDRTFCSSKNCKDKCGRKLTQQVQEGAEKWWGNENAPIAVSEYCDEDGKVIEV